MKLDHGRHNKDVCDHLEDITDYRDWIVTTAFYSAVHYLESHIFPDTYENPINGKFKQYDSLNEYFGDFKYTVEHTNLHNCREYLISEQFPEIYADYKTLKDACWGARYFDYQVTPEEKDICRDCIDNIAELCEPLE